MSSFTLTQLALADLKAIARFTENRWERQQRNAYLKQFDDTFHLLANTPSLGKRCDYIREGYQKFPQSSHIIFYRANSKPSIEIIRILHKSMDVDSKFGDS